MSDTPTGPEQFDTVARAARAEIEISRSTFLCFLFPASSVAEAREHIAKVRAQHPKARHHCTAMVFGPAGDLVRSNDDGEPAGTAGTPMLEGLQGAGLTDVVAVVVRYFGGVLLGTGGLSRAYRAAVVAAVERAPRRTRVRRRVVTVGSDYGTASTIEAAARRAGFTIGQAEYGERVRQELFVPEARVADCVALVAECSAGAATCAVGEPRFVDAV